MSEGCKSGMSGKYTAYPRLLNWHTVHYITPQLRLTALGQRLTFCPPAGIEPVLEALVLTSRPVVLNRGPRNIFGGPQTKQNKLNI